MPTGHRRGSHLRTPTGCGGDCTPVRLEDDGSRAAARSETCGDGFTPSTCLSSTDLLGPVALLREPQRAEPTARRAARPACDGRSRASNSTTRSFGQALEVPPVGRSIAHSCAGRFLGLPGRAFGRGSFQDIPPTSTGPVRPGTGRYDLFGADRVRMRLTSLKRIPPLSTTGPAVPWWTRSPGPSSQVPEAPARCCWHDRRGCAAVPLVAGGLASRTRRSLRRDDRVRGARRRCDGRARRDSAGRRGRGCRSIRTRAVPPR